MKKFVKIFGIVVCLLILFSVGVVVLISYNQAKTFVQPDRRVEYVKPSDYGMEYEDISLTTEDGLKLAAWYTPSRNGSAIILLHGFSEGRRTILDVAEMLYRHGYGTLIIDQRSRGMSEGEQFSFGKNEVLDVDAAVQYLLGRPDIEPQRIGALGRSMGGAIILLHAEQNPGIKAVVAESAFTSLPEVVETGVKAFAGLPPFPFADLIQWFVERRLGFPAGEIAPIDHIREISPRAVFFIQGGKDTVVPPDSGQRFYDAASEPRQLWYDPQLGHIEFAYARPKEYEKRVTTFFDRYLLGK